MLCFWDVNPQSTSFPWGLLGLIPTSLNPIRTAMPECNIVPQHFLHGVAYASWRILVEMAVLVVQPVLFDFCFRFYRLHALQSSSNKLRHGALISFSGTR